MEPSFFHKHAFFGGDERDLNLGKERSDFLSPIVSAHQIGLKPTNYYGATVTPDGERFTIWYLLGTLLILIGIYPIRDPMKKLGMCHANMRFI